MGNGVGWLTDADRSSGDGCCCCWTWGGGGATPRPKNAWPEYMVRRTDDRDGVDQRGMARERRRTAVTRVRPRVKVGAAATEHATISWRRPVAGRTRSRTKIPVLSRMSAAARWGRRKRPLPYLPCATGSRRADATARSSVRSRRPWKRPRSTHCPDLIIAVFTNYAPSPSTPTSSLTIVARSLTISPTFPFFSFFLSFLGPVLRRDIKLRARARSITRTVF